MPSSAENEELVISSRTQNYATIPGGAHFREDTAIPSENDIAYIFVIFFLYPPSILYHKLALWFLL